MDVQLPDGTLLQGIPEGTTKSQIAEKLKAGGHAVPDDWLKPSYSERVGAAGKAYDKAVGNEGKITPDLAGAKVAGKTAIAAGEDVLAMGSGVAGDIAGAATSLLTQDPKKGEALRTRMTYTPRTDAGKAGQAYLGALTEPLANIVNKPAEIAKEHGLPITSQVTRAVTDVLPLKVPKVVKAGAKAVVEGAKDVAKRGEEATAVRAAEEAPKQQKVADARDLGIKIPPSELARAPTGKVLEGAAGKARTEIAMSHDNAKVINTKAGEEIGLSNRQSMTPANLERLKQKAFAVYDRVRKAGRIEHDDAYREELERVKDRSAQEHADYPEDVNEAIDNEIKKFNVASADASSMLSKIKSLRERAGRNMRAPDADKFELGLAQKKIATAMENLLERQVADKGLISEFRAARQQLAKIYNVEDALGPSGNISAAVLARQLKRGVPLSGNLKKIAELYTEFPKVMRSVDALGGHAAFSALDYLVGGVEAVANPHKALAIAGAIAGRPLARGIIGSKAYQRAAVKPGEVKPSLVTRGAQTLSKASPALLAAPSEAAPILQPALTYQGSP